MTLAPNTSAANPTAIGLQQVFPERRKSNRLIAIPSSLGDETQQRDSRARRVLEPSNSR
jgi:hypothetical protein